MDTIMEQQTLSFQPVSYLVSLKHRKHRKKGSPDLYSDWSASTQELQLQSGAAYSMHWDENDAGADRLGGDRGLLQTRGDRGQPWTLTADCIAVEYRAQDMAGGRLYPNDSLDRKF